MVKAEIDGILAAEFCQALLAPVVEAYADEKARIFGELVLVVSGGGSLEVVRVKGYRLSVIGYQRSGVV